MRLSNLGAAVAVAGTLDILAACGMTLLQGRPVISMLQAIASGPFGAAFKHSPVAGAATGLGVHYAIMTAMVLAFALIAWRLPVLKYPAPLIAAVFGGALYVIMYWVVLPARWPKAFPQTGVDQILPALAIHIVLVALPIVLILRREALGQIGPR